MRKTMKLKYAVVFGKAPNNYCAYVPELPGCVSTGKTWKKMKAMIREAIELHVEGMLEDGDCVPAPRMSLGKAMAHHLSLEDDYYDPELNAYVKPDYEDEETTFAFVEVEVELPRTPAALAAEPGLVGAAAR